ncbi:MAG: aminodeoxychorismate synthase, component I [Planctomycetota bacterium]|nr:MAG: aminodeoxychorismate synthase, component I [Planctomycetota bacterium]
MAICCKLHYRKVGSSATPAALTQVFSRLNLPSVLGGNVSVAGGNRFSIWAAQPREVFQFWAGDKDPFGKLAQALDKYHLADTHEGQLPEGLFPCGWIGYFSYELNACIELLPQTTACDVDIPLIHLCFYDRTICYDHLDKTWWLVALAAGGDTESVGDKLATLKNLLTQAARTQVSSPDAGRLHNEAVDMSGFSCNMSREYYFGALKKIQRYIYDGDVYQINFSQRFETDYNAHPVDLYHWQNQHNPSPYAAFIDGKNFAIVSASPEMFITIRDGFITTRPIKGTRRRITGAPGAEQINMANFAELVRNEKEQAELNMIIDLERNDIAKICKPGTRRVVQPRTIEAYPTVFHAAATIGGRLRADVTFCDILKAVFPGGSITGAPKIRSMEIIDELEPTQRSVYTGSIGYIGLDGSVCLNIAIRTIIISSGRAFAQTGGGIVADSQPEAEWTETITKARALLAGITAVSGRARPDKKDVKEKRRKIGDIKESRTRWQKSSLMTKS